MAHPCIESWLLADATAIRRGMNLARTPKVPGEPETLPAPCQDRQKNPKTELARAADSTKKELSAKEKDEIAKAMNDMKLVSARCPQGFAPLAAEVERYILRLF